MKKIPAVKQIILFFVSFALFFGSLQAFNMHPTTQVDAQVVSSNLLPQKLNTGGSMDDPGHEWLRLTSTGVSGELLIVTNTTEEMNGNTSSPKALNANPGPDGISLPEAIVAADASNYTDLIMFDPLLSGSVIAISSGLPSISQGNMMIDGNIADDTNPDITLDGNGSAIHGFSINGASNVVIKGFTIQNFKNHGISVTPNTASENAIVENLVFHQNIISTERFAFLLECPEGDHTIIRNVEITSNTILNSGGGIRVHAGTQESATDNQISGLSIINNTIHNPSYSIAVYLSPSVHQGLSHNIISDVEIRGNQISGHQNTSVLINASNADNCHDNLIENIVIAENLIDGYYVTIEILSDSGANSTGNMVSNLSITDNILTGGGIQFNVATGYDANNNTTTNVLIERNHISSCMANGIYLNAGNGGAYENLLENIFLRSNFIYNCSDAGILLHGETSYSPNNRIQGVNISNHTIINNGNSWAGGININTKHSSNIITGVALSNSILWGNEGEDAIRGSLVPDLVTYTLLNDMRFLGENDNMYEDPQFLNPESLNFRLKQFSPCVDTGSPEEETIGLLDLDKKFRIWDGNDDEITIVDRGAWEYGASAMQEINVSGYGYTILSGDAVPTLWDGTDFGAITITEDAVSQVFSIENTGEVILTLTGIPVVEINGMHADDFSVESQPREEVLIGESVTFTIVFQPSGPGVRKATVSIANDDSLKNPYTFAIKGVGMTPLEKIYLPAISR